MKCPKCGYENKDDALYCNLCQKPFGKEKPRQIYKEEIQDYSKEFMQRYRVCMILFGIRNIIGLIVLLCVGYVHTKYGITKIHLPDLRTRLIVISVILTLLIPTIVGIILVRTLKCPKCKSLIFPVFYLGCLPGWHWLKLKFQFLYTECCPHCGTRLLKFNSKIGKILKWISLIS